jgi:hypothetical protein
VQQVGEDCCGQLGGKIGERSAVATKMSDCTAIAAFARGPLASRRPGCTLRRW